jgi:hypothetical protein
LHCICKVGSKIKLWSYVSRRIWRIKSKIHKFNFSESLKDWFYRTLGLKPRGIDFHTAPKVEELFVDFHTINNKCVQISADEGEITQLDHILWSTGASKDLPNYSC